MSKDDGMLDTGVWKRTGEDTMTRNAFYLCTSIVICLGLIMTYWISGSTANWHPGRLQFFLVGLGVPFLGIYFSASDSPLMSFLGFVLVVSGLSAIMGPLLARYAISDPGLIERAASMTGLVVGVMGISGLIFPSFYKSIGGVLFISLTALVFVSIVRIFIPALHRVGVIDYIGVGIFSLYVGYDMYRASTIPATLDNAIDVAIALYLDIINIFLKLMRIMKK